MESALLLLSCTISVAGIWFLLFSLYPDYFVDAFRESMFSIRDRLFRYAESGRIRFDHPAYRLLRNTMNGFIRFGHRISVPEFAVWSILLRGQGNLSAETFPEEWHRAVATLSPKVKEDLLAIRNEMNAIVVRHAMLNSPLFMASVVPPILGLLLVRLTFKGLVQLLRIDRLDSLALSEGNRLAA